MHRGSIGAPTCRFTRYGDRGVIERLSRSLTRIPPLDEAVWIQRHRGLRWLLAVQSVAVLGVCLAKQGPSLQPLLTGLLLALCMAVASWRAIPRRVQQCAVALGLFSVSAALVRLSGGNIAAHFHYFVMLPFLALYEDGLPFAVGVGYVVLQHGLYGSLAPRMVYPSGDGEGAQPWLWAGVHGLALLAASLALNIHWRASQRIRRQLVQSQRDLASLRALSQAVARSDDGRQLVTDHVQALTGAAWVALVEPEDAATLRFTISTLGCPLLGQRIVRGAETSVINDVFSAREERLIPDVHADPAVSPRLLERVPDTRSIFYLPVDRVDDVAGVLVVAWHAVVTSVTERRTALVALAAHEAGIALERLESVRRLERIAVTDPLTELPNRRLWDHEIALALPAAARSGAPLAVAVLDMNDFKGVNDAEGHAAGDRLLLASARAWRDVLRASDLLVRFGGDEFAVLLPDCPREETGVVATRLKQAVPHGPGVSVGIVVWDGIESAGALVRRADAALYADKGTRTVPVGSRTWT